MEDASMERSVVHHYHRTHLNKEPKYLDNWSSNNNNNNNKAAANSAKMETSNNPDHHNQYNHHQYHHNEILTPSASALLQSKDFKMAVDIMTRWYRAFGAAVKGEELKNFVNCFVEEVLRMQPSIFKQQNPSRNNNNNSTSNNNSSNVGYFANLDQLSCPICFGILTEPVTTLCGHSYCRKCLQKERSGSSCRRCRQPFTHTDLSTCKLNVLLGSLIEKWWQLDLNAAKFRTEGNSLFEGNDRDRALAKYSQALSLVPTDHLTLGNLSHVLLSLGRSEEALAEIDEAIKNSPFWGKGYFRKSAVLISLGRYEEAFVHLAVCAGLVILGKTHDDPSVTPVKTEMLTVLHRIFLNAVGGGSGGRAGSSSSNRRHSCDPNSPYPNFKSSSYHRTGTSEMGTESECSSVEDGSSPEEDRHRSGGKVTVMRKRNNSNGHQAQAIRITRIFDRALGDVKRKYGELRERNSEGTAQICREPVTVSAADLECTLCYRLLHEPISTVCGHTFCRSCLERSLDHSTLCPLCKTSLEDYMGHRKPAVNEAIETVISQFLPKDHAERVEQHLEDIAQASGTDRSDDEIPIFVCTMAFPGVPCPLHVFEPKYRLMIRRCMESGTRRFGMCCYVEGGEHNYGDVGTLLEIQNIQYFPDGRSVVDTIGRRRFKVLNKSIKDGYNMARIELLQDRAVEPVDIPQLEAIHNQVYLEAKDWLESVSQVLRQRIVTHFGAMPDPEENWMESPDGPAWTWWLLAILPLVTKAQVAILGMTGLQRRLESIQKVLRYVTAKQT